MVWVRVSHPVIELVLGGEMGINPSFVIQLHEVHVCTIGLNNSGQPCLTTSSGSIVNDTVAIIL